MASRHTVKKYVENSYYHIYNRGINKEPIYLDPQDYKVFLKYLSEYLSPPGKDQSKKIDININGRLFKGIPRTLKNFSENVDLISFALMPNHLHLLIKQKQSNDIKELLHSLLLRYSGYFNKRYSRIGPLFQGRYKAILIENENYLLHLSRYIHLNPFSIERNPRNHYSSYLSYIGKYRAKWIKPQAVLEYFSKQNTHKDYQDFVESYLKSPQPIDELEELLLE